MDSVRESKQKDRATLLPLVKSDFVSWSSYDIRHCADQYLDDYRERYGELPPQRLYNQEAASRVRTYAGRNDVDSGVNPEKNDSSRPKI